MSHQDLLHALEIVHEELRQSEHLDPAEVERLRGTMREIHEALDRQDDESGTFSDRISESARHFEESHPRLTHTLGRVADMLQQMGI